VEVLVLVEEGRIGQVGQVGMHAQLAREPHPTHTHTHT
jgi:hypothetical protein